MFFRTMGTDIRSFEIRPDPGLYVILDEIRIQGVGVQITAIVIIRCEQHGRTAAEDGDDESSDDLFGGKMRKLVMHSIFGEFWEWTSKNPNSVRKSCPGTRCAHAGYFWGKVPIIRHIQIRYGFECEPSRSDRTDLSKRSELVKFCKVFMWWLGIHLQQPLLLSLGCSRSILSTWKDRPPWTGAVHCRAPCAHTRTPTDDLGWSMDVRKPRQTRK